MSLGEKINKLRKEKGYTQDDLANEIGVTRQTISKWELSDTSPDIIQAQKLANVFGISLDSLVNDSKDEEFEESVEENKEEVKCEEKQETTAKSNNIVKYLIVTVIVILIVMLIIAIAKTLGGTNISQNTMIPGHHGFGLGHE